MENIWKKIENNKSSNEKSFIVNEVNNTKTKTDTIIYSEEKLEEIYRLIVKLIWDYEESDIDKLINISNELSEYNMYQILYYLIENWIRFAPLYANKLSLNTSEIHINLFIEWLKSWWDELFFSENNLSFLEMYRDIDELIKILWIEWFFEQYDYFLLNNPDLWKIEKKDTLKAIKNFKDVKFTWNTLDKINTYWIYDWDIIIDNIFEDSTLAKKEFFKLFILSKKEKQDLKNMKVDFLNYEYNDEIEDLIEETEETNKSLYYSMKFSRNNDLDIENKTNILLSKITEVCILKNPFNEFLITFMDITWKRTNLELTSKIQRLISNYNTHEDYNSFIKEFKLILYSYIDFFKINDFNFDVLIFKSNWDKDWDDNESVNNIFFTWKELKSA